MNADELPLLLLALLAVAAWFVYALITARELTLNRRRSRRDPVDLPPGIPSITERLDRWKDGRSMDEIMRASGDAYGARLDEVVLVAEIEAWLIECED